MVEVITSTSNPKIKRLIALQQKSSLRCESALFVVEGRREIVHCIEGGYEIDTLFVCPEICGDYDVIEKELRAVEWQNRGNLVVPVKIFEVSAALYSKIAYREGTEGLIAEVRAKSHSLEDLNLGADPLVVVLEGVEKPGNIGAVLRTCDAAGVDALIVCDPKSDILNPNLIRASLGAVFTVPVAVCSSGEAISFLKARGIRILTAQLQDSALYYDCDMKGACAIVMGTEATGLTNAWREAASSHIRIPMLGQLDSLNVSVSTAVLVYEALRQRK